jgi:hypothetical protein
MEGISLREISRRLGYSVSSLHEHQKKGRFKPLSDGSYDIGDVVDGLLQWSIPSEKHRSALESNKARARSKSVRLKAKSLTPERKAAEDAGVAAVMALVRSDEVCEAVGLLGRLPRQMLGEFQKHDKIEYPENTLRGFERDTIDWLVRCIKAARDE